MTYAIVQNFRKNGGKLPGKMAEKLFSSGKNATNEFFSFFSGEIRGEERTARRLGTSCASRARTCPARAVINRALARGARDGRGMQPRLGKAATTPARARTTRVRDAPRRAFLIP